MKISPRSANNEKILFKKTGSKPNSEIYELLYSKKDLVKLRQAYANFLVFTFFLSYFDIQYCV